MAVDAGRGLPGLREGDVRAELVDEVRGVLGRKAFFQVKMDMEAWSTIITMFPAAEIPDWWMVGPILDGFESIGVMPDGTQRVDPGVLIATSFPQWFMDRGNGVEKPPEEKPS